MARQNFSVVTDNTPAIDGVFAVNLMFAPGSSPTQEGPHQYIVGGRALPTTSPSWDGSTVTWTVIIKGKTYQFIGNFSEGSEPFTGTVNWNDPEGGQDGWSAGSGQEEDEELSASA